MCRGRVRSALGVTVQDLLEARLSADADVLPLPFPLCRNVTGRDDQARGSVENYDGVKPYRVFGGSWVLRGEFEAAGCSFKDEGVDVLTLPPGSYPHELVVSGVGTDEVGYSGDVTRA